MAFRMIEKTLRNEDLCFLVFYIRHYLIISTTIVICKVN